MYLPPLRAAAGDLGLQHPEYVLRSVSFLPPHPGVLREAISSLSDALHDPDMGDNM